MGSYYAGMMNATGGPYLRHHGVDGMHWGVRNGPPYPIGSQLKNKVPCKIKTIKNYNGKLYWLSEEDLDGKIMKPRVPDNYFTRNGFEENKIKRLCFSPTVDQCLMAMSQNLSGRTFYIYEPSIPIKNVKKPNVGAVPDSGITGELWVCEPVSIMKTGAIKVIGDDGKDGIPFAYGDNTAELYGWVYEKL